ncbi:MBL fold metallo-hydrolase [Nakamurella deserti]|uniref:MBL fold metallo-hydrolase n=1 Tax=Nakamurella deserti TaxID=2164074 RepID=UPI000DBE288A|nr:MBL fold metallo-hydrolase [Nakamurella deserti]
MRTPVEVADGVHVATSVLDMTTSTVLVHGDEALLVDPSWTPDELAGLADWLDHRGLTVVGGFATHAHHDHVLWHPRFGHAPRWASAVTARRAAESRQHLVSALGDWPADLTPLVGRLTAAEGLPWPEPVEPVVHDAHTPGHTALWLPGPRVLIAGDMLSDVEPPLPEETGPSEYVEGLETLRPYAERAALVIPGHGHPGTDVVARWRRDLAEVSGPR